MSNASKMDTNAVFEMFEAISKKLDKRTDTPTEPVQVDLSAIDTLTGKLEDAIEEVRKPSKVEHQHRHTIAIQSNWFLFSWVLLVVIIFTLFWTLANHRQVISDYRNNDLKYRYIKMQGQTDAESLYRLEQQFRYSDSIQIIRNQVEKYEESVKEQARKLEQAQRKESEAEQLRKEADNLKAKPID